MTHVSLTAGMVIDYRGRPAEVIEVAINEQSADAVIEWEEAGSTHRCRLVWDSLDAETTDGLNGEPLTLWGE